MKSLATLLNLEEGTRLTGVVTPPFARTLRDVSGSILLHTVLGLSVEGSIAGPALSEFLPRNIAVIHGVQPDGDEWAAVFEHWEEDTQPQRDPALGFLRAMDLLGVGGHRVQCREFDWADMVQLFEAADCSSVIDWSLTDLILAQVINLWTGDLSSVVGQVTADAPTDGTRASHRRLRIDHALREWASHYRGPEHPGLA